MLRLQKPRQIFFAFLQWVKELFGDAGIVAFPTGRVGR
jgi:hypothetical protein